ncbi:MAG TPA: hypothetical protein VGJ28_01795, partial [Micromonosporaceae bacterium]
RRNRIRQARRAFQPRAIWLLGIALVMVAVVGFVYVQRPLHLGDPSGAAYPTAAVPSGVTATTSPVPTAKPSVDSPFAGTPAESWPDGTAGMTMPAAKAVGRWTASQVSADLARVRTALIASHLDHRLLINHDPSTFIALLATSHRSDVVHNIRDYDTSLIRIAPGARLSTAAPKVSGRTTYAQSTWGRIPVLEVITNYVWVYPFDGATGSRVAIVHGEEHWFFPPDSAVAAGDRGMTLYTVAGYLEMIDCAQANQGFVAPAPEVDPSSSPNPAATEPSDNYFQPNHTLTVPTSCVRPS